MLFKRDEYVVRATWPFRLSNSSNASFLFKEFFSQNFGSVEPEYNLQTVCFFAQVFKDFQNLKTFLEFQDPRFHILML